MLDGHEAHVRARDRFAHGRRVVGVVLAAMPLHPVRRHEAGRDQPEIEPQRDELARPVMRTQ